MMLFQGFSVPLRGGVGATQPTDGRAGHTRVCADVHIRRRHGHQVPAGVSGGGAVGDRPGSDCAAVHEVSHHA